MRKPSQMEAFDALYAIAAGGDREAALFGSSIELARPAFERMLVGDGYPDVYLEFPLLGNPCFDLLSVYGSIEPGVRFAAGAGFGRQDLFDWFAGACAADGVSCGLELDISAGETERAGVYLQQRMHTELVKPFLASIGEAARVQSYLDVLARMPRGWQPAYVGLFPGRHGTPLRIGGYLALPDQRRCATDSGHTAASALGIGDFYLSPYRLSAPYRMRSNASSASFATRRVKREDVSFSEGLPVTRLERTLVDLVLDDEDPSLVIDAHEDARSRGIDESRLEMLVRNECGRSKSRVAMRLFFGEASDVNLNLNLPRFR